MAELQRGQRCGIAQDHHLRIAVRQAQAAVSRRVAGQAHHRHAAAQIGIVRKGLDPVAIGVAHALGQREDGLEIGGGCGGGILIGPEGQLVLVDMQAGIGKDRARIADQPARMVGMQMRHHDPPDLVGRDADRLQRGGQMPGGRAKGRAAARIDQGQLVALADQMHADWHADGLVQVDDQVLREIEMPVGDGGDRHAPQGAGVDRGQEGGRGGFLGKSQAAAQKGQGQGGAGGGQHQVAAGQGGHGHLLRGRSGFDRIFPHRHGLHHGSRASSRKGENAKHPAAGLRGAHASGGSDQARSLYSNISVLTMIASPSPTKGGIMMRTPLSRIAGL